MLLDGFPSASGLADANDIRLALAGLILRDTSGNPRTGVLPRHLNALVSSTATMNSSVAAAEFVLSRPGQGTVFLPNNGATNVLHDAPPVANSRYDVVWVKQNDSVSPNLDTDSLPVFGILKGAASPTPTQPTWASAKASVPAGAEPLAAVLIPSTATTTSSSGVIYTMLYQYTCATGGSFLVRNFAELSSLPGYVQSGYPVGTRARAITTGIVYEWSGLRWTRENLACPGGVAGTGVVLSDDGTVTTSGALQNIDILDVFSNPRFENYRITFDVASANAADDWVIQFIQGTTPYSAASQLLTQITMSSNTPSGLYLPNNDGLPAGRMEATGMSVSIDVFGPNLPQHTRTVGSSNDSGVFRTFGGSTKVATQFTGFRLKRTGAGTTVSKVRVMGIN